MNKTVYINLDKPLPDSLIKGRIIYLLIKYANDLDVGIFLKNCNPLIFQPYMIPGKNRISNKEILIESLLNKQHNVLLLLHLNALYKCYDSYNFSSDYNAEQNLQKIFNNSKLSDEYSGYDGEGTVITFDNQTKVISVEDFNNFANLNNSKIEKIQHVLIESGKKYGFYYYFNLDILTKTEITLNANGTKAKIKTKKYNIIHRTKQNSLLEDTNTGLKFDLGKNLKLNDENQKNNSDKFFITLNNRIYNIINTIDSIEPCSWCTPDKEYPAMRRKCENCTNLVNELKTVLKVNFNEKIREIDYSKAKDINCLRKKRADMLKKYIIKKADYITTEDINRLMMLIDKSFKRLDISE